jgi:CheY-like chemotaxis protein
MTAESLKHKILLLDDDPDVLELYQQMLLQLPSQPEVHIASSGARAMSMLDAEPFSVLVCDLNMPKMDGLQVIAIVRRKYPRLRTVVITGLADEQMRARAYAMGVDLYLEKPANQQEFGFLQDCVESLLDKEQTAGFRGVQSKTLVDLVQLECLSGSSSVLKITNGKLDARIWIQNGEVIDARADEQEGEAAFRRILSWKTGNFEILPAEAEHPRKIETSYQAILLDSAQAVDESGAPKFDFGGETDTQFFRKEGFGQMYGVEFAFRLPNDKSLPIEKWGIEDVKQMGDWASKTLSLFEALGEKHSFGSVQEVDARGLQGCTRIVAQSAGTVVIGMLPSVSAEEANQNTAKVLERWGL